MERYVQADKSFNALHKALTKYIYDGLKMGLRPDQGLIDQWGLRISIELSNPDNNHHNVPPLSEFNLNDISDRKWNI